MKPIITITEQIELLKSQNLIFGDESKAEQFLQHNNYYRLSGYWQKYQIDHDKGKNNFVDNTTFEQIIAIYELDVLLRNILQKGIVILEVSFRSKFAYYMAHSAPNGQLLYHEHNSYNNKISKDEKPGDLLKKINKEIERSIDKSVTLPYQRVKDIPILISIEMLSFNTVSRMYSRWINREINKKVSGDFKLFKDYGCSIKVIRYMVVLRNMCAHQERIWNKRLVIDQVVDKEYLQKFGPSNKASQWRVISILMALVDDINRNQSYSQDVMNLCKQNEEFFKGLIEPIL
jgi:abortive infection bacteriophage resistance protein